MKRRTRSPSHLAPIELEDGTWLASSICSLDLFGKGLLNSSTLLIGAAKVQELFLKGQNALPSTEPLTLHRRSSW